MTDNKKPASAVSRVNDDKSQQQQQQGNDNMNNLGYTNICPDGHACDNDSTCMESILQERKYVCDCYDAYEQTGRVFAGVSCQHMATEYCTSSGELSQTLFCTNQGTCQSKVTASSSQHPGCRCPKGYTGAHCEYVEGSVPLETSYFWDGTTYAHQFYKNHRQGVEEGLPMNPAAIVMPILSVVFLALGLTLWKYRRMTLGHVHDKSKQPDVNMLEADGSASMADVIGPTSTGSFGMGKRNSTPTFSSTHKAALMEPPDFENLLEQSDHVHFHKDYTGSRTHKLFASDPTLNYTPTMETTGSGSPTNAEEEEAISGDNHHDVFQEEDLNSPSPFQDVTSPTFERNHARILASFSRSREMEEDDAETFEEYNPKDFLPGHDPTFL